MSEETVPYGEPVAPRSVTRPAALDTLRGLAEKAPGELRYWPTHYAGTTPYIIAAAPDGRETRLFVAQNREGKTADTELHGSEGDRAIAYAKRMTEAANALPDILDYVAHLERLVVQSAAPSRDVKVPAEVARRGGLAANTAAKFLRTNEAAAKSLDDASTAFIAGHQAKALEDLIDAIDPNIRKGEGEPNPANHRTT